MERRGTPNSTIRAPMRHSGTGWNGAAGSRLFPKLRVVSSSLIARLALQERNGLIASSRRDDSLDRRKPPHAA